MKPLVNKRFKLEKYPGKGGWTYARIPKFKLQEISGSKVKGSVDCFEIRKAHLLPMGSNHFFFPIRSEIRKKIGKEHGDFVVIVLYPDNDDLEIPAEMLECLQEERTALLFFNKLTESQRKYYIDWVTSAKKIETKVERLSKAIYRLSRNLKFYDPEK
ncbi:MAG: YdeI/OmpD-associated family protein [Chryseolinea sp.]